MVAYDSAAAMIKHYRVDKMEKISIMEEDRDGLEAYQALDMAVYARKTFGMFTGQEKNVVLRFENHLVGAVLDRLGRDVFIVPDGPDHFTVRTDVIVSPQFFAWVLWRKRSDHWPSRSRGRHETTHILRFNAVFVR